MRVEPAGKRVLHLCDSDPSQRHFSSVKHGKGFGRTLFVSFDIIIHSDPARVVAQPVP